MRHERGVIRTLIVEDDPGVSRMLVKNLEALEGFEVVGTAATGAAAVEFAATNDIDLILLDMHLPDFSGIEVLHRIRLQSAEIVDVIVVSSANESVTVRLASAALVVGYLVKPFSRSVFELRLVAYRAVFLARSADSARTTALAQADIDGVIARRAVTASNAVIRLPKGLAPSTASLVLKAVGESEVNSATEVAGRCGLARGTARRYLDYLQRTGVIVVAHRYGVRGRPELLYSIAPG